MTLFCAISNSILVSSIASLYNMSHTVIPTHLNIFRIFEAVQTKFVFQATYLAGSIRHNVNNGTQTQVENKGSKNNIHMCPSNVLVSLILNSARSVVLRNKLNAAGGAPMQREKHHLCLAARSRNCLRYVSYPIDTFALSTFCIQPPNTHPIPQKISTSMPNQR